MPVPPALVLLAATTDRAAAAPSGLPERPAHGPLTGPIANAAHCARRRALAASLPLLGLLLGAALMSAGAARAAEPAAATGWQALKADAAIVLFRHAEAPGIGDPSGFKLGECATQRNLNDAGRAQARRLGERFRSTGIRVGQVLSSQWCRTRETAELAFPGQVREAPAFNSFFEERPAEPAQTRAALDQLGAWRGPGTLVVVTHQVNITALTGVYPSSGEGIVVRPDGKSGLAVVGRVKP